MASNEVREFCPINQDEWRKWLEKNAATSDFVWLIIYKVKSGKSNISWSKAVDEALCFGWIDSVKKSIDNEKYKQYFGPRKPKSIWSKINKDKVEELIESGKMTDAGKKCIDIAKENGSWNTLDSVDALIVPDDLRAALQKFSEANAYFESLSKSTKKFMLYWIISAKRPATREKRILEIAECASRKEKPKQF